MKYIFLKWIQLKLSNVWNREIENFYDSNILEDISCSKYKNSIPSKRTEKFHYWKMISLVNNTNWGDNWWIMHFLWYRVLSRPKRSIMNKLYKESGGKRNFWRWEIHGFLFLEFIHTFQRPNYLATSDCTIILCHICDGID